MPQFDKITFFTQIFWLFFFFSSFYLIFLKVFLPKLSSVLKARTKKLQKGSEGVANFIEEQNNVIENFNFSIEQISFVVKTSMDESKQKMNFWSKSLLSSLNDRNLNKSNNSMERILYKQNLYTLSLFTIKTPTIKASLLPSLAKKII
jgi:hypothetical protein